MMDEAVDLPTTLSVLLVQTKGMRRTHVLAGWHEEIGGRATAICGEKWCRGAVRRATSEDVTCNGCRNIVEREKASIYRTRADRLRTENDALRDAGRYLAGFADLNNHDCGCLTRWYEVVSR